MNNVLHITRILYVKWKEFDKNDSGLYVNRVALTNDFKQIAYDA